MARSATPTENRKPVTVPSVRAHKARDGKDPLVMVTAYDAPGARVVDEAGVDMILVGDSVAMVVLGYDDTLQVTVEDIAHHTAAVARTRPIEIPQSRISRGENLQTFLLLLALPREV